MFSAKIRTGKNSFTVIIDGQSYSVDRNHKNYDKLNQLFISNDSEGFVELFNIKLHNNIESFVKDVETDEEFTFKDGKIFMNGEELHGVISERINQMREDGEDFQYMLNFLKNINKNTSARAKREAYDFIANKHLPITEDGYLLGYKCVQSDYFSKTSGKLKLVQGTIKDGRIYNGIGETIECDRSDVDDNREQECSYGLHVGGLAYSGPQGSFHSNGDKVVIVKVNPADIVAVPKDYNAQKTRVCKYIVLTEYVKPLSSSVEKLDDEEDYEYEDDYYEEEYEEEDYSDDEWEDEDDEDDEPEPLSRRLTEIGEPVVVFYDKKVRSVIFLEEHEDHFIVLLSEADSKYDADESNIRNFKKEKCQIV